MAGPTSEIPKITKPLPPPFINISTLPNLRDIGGYRVQRGPSSTVRKRALYRSADPSRLSPADLAHLHTQLNIRTIFDLRSEPEIARSGTLPAYEATLAGCPGVTRRWTPVFAAEDYGPEAVALRFKDYGADEQGEAGFVRAYEQILSHAGPALREILRHLAEDRAPEEGVLVHCSAGKDRAGCVVAVILSLLGVEKEVVAEEYSLTEEGLREMRPYFVERLLASGAFAQGDEGRAAAERMVGSRKNAMLQTIRLVEEMYGGVEGYVRDVVGLDQASIEKIRANYIVADVPKANGQL